MLGITQALDDSDYVLTLQLAAASAPSDKTMRYLLGGNVDGTLVVSHHSGDDFFTTLAATIPVVFGGRPYRPELHRNHFVDVDNAAEAATGTQHLDAVFVAPGLAASGAMSVLQQRDTLVPGEVAVVGFDDSSAATSGDIGLTTAHQPSREMSAEMARMLVALLGAEPTERERVMPTRMVVRYSA